MAVFPRIIIDKISLKKPNCSRSHKGPILGVNIGVQQLPMAPVLMMSRKASLPVAMLSPWRRCAAVDVPSLVPRAAVAVRANP